MLVVGSWNGIRAGFTATGGWGFLGATTGGLGAGAGAGGAGGVGGGSTLGLQFVTTNASRSHFRAWQRNDFMAQRKQA